MSRPKELLIWLGLLMIPVVYAMVLAVGSLWPIGVLAALGCAAVFLVLRRRRTVKGLPLPRLLLSLMAEGKWTNPGDSIVSSVIPFLQGTVDFLNVDAMRRESQMWAADDDRYSKIFHEVRGSKSPAPVELPWLDVEKAVFIAVNRIHGDDLGIALDYRTNRTDPRVVACEWVSDPRGCIWREVAPSFTEFIRMLDDATKNGHAAPVDSRQSSQ